MYFSTHTMISLWFSFASNHMNTAISQLFVYYFKVSEEGRGIASISPMLTITRIHNAIAALSSMRRFAF